MEWFVLLSAVGLLLVFEGILPFLSPSFWRNMMQQMFHQKDQTLRALGLASMLIGLLIIIMARQL